MLPLFSAGPLHCSEHQNRQNADKEHFGTICYLKFSMCPTTSFNTQSPNSMWKIIIAILMDTVSKHVIKKDFNFKIPQWEDMALFYSS